MPIDNTMDSLYSKLLSLEGDLCKDDEALTWFDLTNAPFDLPSTPPPSTFIPMHSTPSDTIFSAPKGKDNIQGQWYAEKMSVLNKSFSNNRTSVST